MGEGGRSVCLVTERQDAGASLAPLQGGPRDLERLLRSWLSQQGPRPVVVRTSGSSGEPKAVALSAAAVRSSAEATLARLGGPGQWVLALPPRYVAGLQVLVRAILADRPVVVLADHPDIAAATSALAPGSAYLSVVSTQLRRWLGEGRLARALTRFDAVLVGGGAAPAGLLDAARGAGVRVVSTYGMTETCGGCVYDGYGLDGVGVRLDPDGRIWLSGPMLFDGYVDRPDLTAEVLRDGWLRTPDVGRGLDAGGRLEVLGRADDVVVSGGVNVPLLAVEGRLASMPGVRQCVVLGVPDEEWGSRIVAVVAAEADSALPSLGAVRDFVSAQCPRAWAPRAVIAVAAIPMLASGKPDRQALRDLVDSAAR